MTAARLLGPSQPMAPCPLWQNYWSGRLALDSEDRITGHGQRRTRERPPALQGRPPTMLVLFLQKNPIWAEFRCQAADVVGSGNARRV